MKRQQILKEHTGEEEDWAEEYRNQLWTARYGKRRLQKDEFVRCLMELKYLAEGTTLNLGGDRKKMGAQILSTLCLTEAMQLEEGYRQILLEELYNVFLKFIQVSRGGRGFTFLVFGMGQLSEEGIAKKIRRTDQRDCLQSTTLAPNGKRILPAPGSCPPSVSSGISE